MATDSAPEPVKLAPGSPQAELEKFRIEAQLRRDQMRFDFLKVLAGTMIVGVAAAFFPFAQEYARAYFAERTTNITTEAEFKRLQEANRLAEQLEEKKHSLEVAKQSTTDIGARRSYLEQLAGDARSERIERQIVVAEFFAFLAEPEMQKQWTGFRDYLIEKQKKLNEEKASLLATTANPDVSVADRNAAEERIGQINRLQNPSSGIEPPMYNEPLPPALPGESRLGREMLALAVKDLNSGIDEVNQRARVGNYWEVLGQNFPGAQRDLPWSAAFISWLISTSGNPHKLALSASGAALWKSAASKGLTKLLGNGAPVAGDLAFRARGSGRPERIRDGQPAPSIVGIIYKVTSDQMSVIAGNLDNALRMETWRLNDPMLVGFVHFPDPPVPIASEQGGPAGGATPTE
jgi:hypothetical protein